MPSAEHSRVVEASLPEVWNFVRDMDHWAPLVIGYQRHEKRSERDSYWVLKGELGGLSRIAEFEVHIDEWDESGRVAFSLKGVNEPVTGLGSFHAVAIDAAPEPGARRPSTLIGRIVAFIRWFRRSPPTPNMAGVESLITFKLTLTASGRAGLVLNALLAPMMKPVAEDLANKIAQAIMLGR